MLLGDYKDLKTFKKAQKKKTLTEQCLIYTHSLEYYYHAPKEALIIAPRINFPNNYVGLPLFFSKKKEGARFIDPIFILEHKRVDFFEHPFKKFLYKEIFQLQDKRVIFDELVSYEQNKQGYFCQFQEQNFQTQFFYTDLLKKNLQKHFLLLKVQGDFEQDLLLKKDHFFLGNLKEGWFLTLIEDYHEKTILKTLKELKQLLIKQSFKVSLEGLYLEHEEKDFFLKALDPYKPPWT